MPFYERGCFFLFISRDSYKKHMFYLKLPSGICICFAMIIGFVMSGCSSTSELFRETSVDKSVDADYSIIYYIHADSDYLYHEPNGNPVRGNRMVLETAMEIAEGAESGEVFIFYQQPSRKFLGLFPRRSSRFYHYQNGELINKVGYRYTDKSEDFLTTEASLYHEYRFNTGNNDKRSHFFYFGHEIPDDDGTKYHRTMPNIEVNVESFSMGLQKFFDGDEHRFDLIVLSTCNNGTPFMVSSLLSISDVLLASPQNLHLSHVDTDHLRDLESNSEVSSIHLAQSMADQTYKRLESEILTEITLTVYDLEEVRQYHDDLHQFTTSSQKIDQKPSYEDNIDCNEVEVFNVERFKRGLLTWFKPARFGRRSNTDSHSGWGCRPLVPDAD